MFGRHQIKTTVIAEHQHAGKVHGIVAPRVSKQSKTADAGAGLLDWEDGPKRQQLQTNFFSPLFDVYTGR